MANYTNIGDIEFYYNNKQSLKRNRDNYNNNYNTYIEYNNALAKLKCDQDTSYTLINNLGIDICSIIGEYIGACTVLDRCYNNINLGNTNYATSNKRCKVNKGLMPWNNFTLWKPCNNIHCKSIICDYCLFCSGAFSMNNSFIFNPCNNCNLIYCHKCLTRCSLCPNNNNNNHNNNNKVCNGCTETCGIVDCGYLLCKSHQFKCKASNCLFSNITMCKTSFHTKSCELQNWIPYIPIQPNIKNNCLQTICLYCSSITNNCCSIECKNTIIQLQSQYNIYTLKQEFELTNSIYQCSENLEKLNDIIVQQYNQQNNALNNDDNKMTINYYNDDEFNEAIQIEDEINSSGHYCGYCEYECFDCNPYGAEQEFELSNRNMMKQAEQLIIATYEQALFEQDEQLRITVEGD